VRSLQQFDVCRTRNNSLWMIQLVGGIFPFVGKKPQPRFYDGSVELQSQKKAGCCERGWRSVVLTPTQCSRSFRFARQPKHRGVVRDRKDRKDHDGPPIIPIRPIFSDPPSFRLVADNTDYSAFVGIWQRRKFSGNFPSLLPSWRSILS
jgi:hypothetical protein